MAGGVHSFGERRWRSDRFGGTVRAGLARAIASLGVLLFLVACIISGAARAAEPVYSSGRVSASRKGSVLLFSLVELRWDANGTVIQDTFIELSNDYPADVWVELYLVNGDPPLEATATERAHPGWNASSARFLLNASEPAYWSALHGQPAGVPPFTVLDFGDPPGRPDPDSAHPGERVLRGYILCWAVDAEGREVRWNHLAGTALLVDYASAAAAQSPAWAFQARGVPHGSEPVRCRLFNLDSGQCLDTELVPGQIDLDGFEYDSCPNELLFEFHASGSALPSTASGVPQVAVGTSLVLCTCDVDLRQEGNGPITTKASFDIWNQNEVRFSGTERCITCWDLAPFRAYTTLGMPNHFLVQSLQTDRGKARVQGIGSQMCNVGTTVSRDAALLGVLYESLEFPAKSDKACVPLGVQGDETARIAYDYDVGGPPPEMSGPDED